ncbi:MAG: hypothetical protein F6K17_33500, partial [Okeania sp. SIO3C4]|nr:hypothetical protein [Okeania sp. SIO3C4]
MATNAKPPKKKKGTPPKLEEPLKGNLDKRSANELVPLNFKVPPEFKKEYRLYAAEKEMSLVDILKNSFEVMK